MKKTFHFPQKNFPFSILHSPFSRGFTFIELLIVIAVLSILASAVFVLVNPLEQIERGKDTTRVSHIDQLSKALQAYYYERNTYPADCTTQAGSDGCDWMSELIGKNEIKVRPDDPSSNAACGGADFRENYTGSGLKGYGYCYRSDATNAVIYTTLKSQQRKSTCSSTAWYVYSSANNFAGPYCNSTAPTAGFIHPAFP
jgi:prepilin-type N-terminal cleavage/methylation domain-containing protein